MEFDGEHLIPGKIGHLFVIIAFTATLLSAIGYFTASFTKNELEKQRWISFSKSAFLIHVFSVISIFAILIYICSSHLYEYHYAYKHTSSELEYKYLLASIWEGQEGSFLLWSFWHCILGTVLIFKSKEWQAPVMSVISLVQVFLMLMVLGIYFFGVKFGSSPFSLTRNEIDFSQAPVFTDVATGLLKKNYLQFLKDGVGLNVLLRNYWMVIHPPVLFLGFASTLVPFSFAYAGIQTKKFGDWVKPVVPWTLFSAGILGVGIMMGGKWAYESLNFGGYWAWDPVENASLVPWLILIAGLHTMLIYRATGRSLRASYLFAFLTFSFILYSTYLTRTGVLGETSVHAFVDENEVMKVLLKVFLGLFTLSSLILFILFYKKIPAVHTEESLNTREFWMFIGSVIFFLTALFISAKTSVPVFNKIFEKLIRKYNEGQLIAPPEFVEYSYNKVMMMVAVIIGILSAITQYFKYKNGSSSYTFKKIAIPTLLAIAASTLLFIFYPIEFTRHGKGFQISIYVALFATIYSVVANASYIWVVLKGHMKSAGGSLSHTGFALMLVGMLISSSNRKVLSDSRVNGIEQQLGQDPMNKQMEDPKENLTLIRDLPTTLAGYTATYKNNLPTNEKTKRVFNIEFRDKKTNKAFLLSPDVYTMKDNSISSNPDTKSYWNKDIFTYITATPNKKALEDTAQYRVNETGIGDKVFYSNGYIVLDSVNKNPGNLRYGLKDLDFALTASLTIITKDSMKYRAAPVIYMKDSVIQFLDDTAYAPNLFFRFAGVTEGRKIKLAVKESNVVTDFIAIKSYEFPFIGVVWMGLILMAAGITLSMLHRVKASKSVTIITLLAVLAAMIKMFLFPGS